ncbi:NADPH-dependent FMN reductase [Maritimibacter dapengensis]|uniref:NAD(P)H-dependent oxidoreductase n=1 Tax=Maritimibacter dapengensis TaxID=2836868 RepID=A0ABS6SYN0_9RHOB|nr:NADPH-dependent FMN reductase [Maritimibacter dapengensis]MBV7377461.1 NAD(P)H-dependent oxidoreductase [Maritimibacter dapengensis]
MSRPTILGIPGALRQASTNRLLLRESVRVLGDCQFVEADIDFPVFNEDIENGPGIPEAVQTLFDQIDAADAVIISSPEYNKNIPGVLKNALDWVSRCKGNPWKDKPVSLIAASDGRAGGERMMHNLILCMMPFRPDLVYGPEIFIGNSREAFDNDGRLKDERSVKFLTTLMENLRETVKA